MPDFIPPSTSRATKHQVDAGSNDASFVVPQSQSTSTRPADFSHSRIFQYGKWLVIMAVSVVGIGAVVAIIVATQASLPNISSLITNPSPTPVKTEIATTRKEGDDSYFAGLPLTILYYSYSQTSNTKNVFQANPSDSESRFLNIGFEHITPSHSLIKS